MIFRSTTKMPTAPQVKVKTDALHKHIRHIHAYGYPRDRKLKEKELPLN